MKKFLKAVSLATLIVTSGVSHTMAQGIPVIDASSIAQLIASVNNQATQIANQVQQITELQNQLANMQQRLTAITGAKGLSTLLNDPTEQLRRQAATSLNSISSSAISGTPLSGGNTGRINSTINSLKSKFDLTNLAAFDSSTIPQDRGIAMLAGAGLTAAATGEDAYARSNEGMTRVNNLIGQIDTTPDLKSSVDLNTRVLAEMSQQLNEMMRVMAASTTAQGTSALAKARNEAAGRKFQKIGN